MTFKTLERYLGLNWPGWIRVIIWVSVIIALFAETMRNFIPLLDDYRHNNNGTQIGVIKDEWIDRPNDMTICIPYYSGEIEAIVEELTNNWQNNNNFTCDTETCRAMKSHSWDVWSNMSMPFKYGESEVTYGGGKSGRSKIRKLLVEIPAAIMRKLSAYSSENFELVLNLTEDSNFNWNQPIIDAVWYYLSCMSSFDIYFLLDPDRSLGWWSADDCRLIINSTSLTGKDVINKLYEKLLQAIETFTITGFEGDTFKRPNLKDRHGLALWDAMLCYLTFPALQTDRVYFKNLEGDGFAAPWNRLNPTEALFQIYGDSTPLYNHPISSFAIYNGVDHAEDVTVFYKIQSRVVDKRDGIVCSLENTPALCMAKMQLEHVTKRFHCVPFALRHLTNNTEEMPYCDLSIYLNDKEKLKRQNEFRAICETKCTYIFTNWKITIGAQKHFTMDNRSGLICDLVALQSLFIEFRLIDQNTFQQFLSQVGGIANLYLGLSGLTACTVFIFLIDLCKKWSHLKNDSQNPQSLQANNPTNINWTNLFNLFQMKTFLHSLKDQSNANDQTNIDEIWRENENLKNVINNITKEFKDFKSAYVEEVEILSKKQQSIEDKHAKEQTALKELINTKNHLKKRNSLT